MSTPASAHTTTVAAAAASAASTSEPLGMTLLNPCDSTNPAVLVYRCSRTTSAIEGAVPKTVYIITSGGIVDATQRREVTFKLRQEGYLVRHDNILPLDHIRWDVPFSSIPGKKKPEHSCFNDKLVHLLVTADLTNCVSLASFIASHSSIKQQLLTQDQLLSYMDGLMRAFLSLEVARLPLGDISPHSIYFSSKDGGLPIKLGGLGLFQCFTTKQQQERVANSHYYSSNAIRSNDCNTILKADRTAIFHCLLDLASMKLSTTKVTDHTNTIKKIGFSKTIKEIFTNALSGNKSTQDLMDQIIKLLPIKVETNQSSSSTTTPTSSLIAMPPMPTSTPIAVNRHDDPMEIDLTANSPSDSPAASNLVSPASSIAADAIVPCMAVESHSRPISFHALYQGNQTTVLKRQFPIPIQPNLTHQQQWNSIRTYLQDECSPNSPEPVLIVEMTNMNQLLDTVEVGSQFVSRLLNPQPNQQFVLLVYDAGTPQPFDLVYPFDTNISIVPNTSTMTDDPGQYSKYYDDSKNALPIAWSFGEFVDNSLSAMRKNVVSSRRKEVMIYLLDYQSDLHIVFHDVGSGMDLGTLREFATYGLSRKARKENRDPSDPDDPNYLSCEIGEFGVGSSNAAFFNARVLSVMTGQKNTPQITNELEIDADKMAEAEKFDYSTNAWFAHASSRARGSLKHSKLNPTMLQRKQIQLLVKEETQYDQFTRVILSRVKPHSINLIRQQKAEILAELIRIYRFYLFGLDGLPNAASCSQEDGMTIKQQWETLLAQQSQRPSANQIGIKYYKNDQLDQNFNFPDIACLLLDDSLYNISPAIQLMTAHQGKPFRFRGRLTNPKTGNFTLYRGLIYYYPYVDGTETHPEYKELAHESQQLAQLIDGDTSITNGNASPNQAAAATTARGRSKQSTVPVVYPAPVFELSWHGRVIPETTVESLDFIDSACKKLPLCRYRLKGALHFVDSDIMKPSKNKLTLERQDLTPFLNANSTFEKMEGNTYSRLSNKFEVWLKHCHDELDREIETIEESRVIVNGQTCFTQVRYRINEDRYDIEPNTLISFRSSNKMEYGRFIRYSVDVSGKGTFIYYRLPKELQNVEQEVTKSAQYFQFLDPRSIKDAYKRYEKMVLTNTPSQVKPEFTIMDVSGKYPSTTLPTEGMANVCLSTFSAGVKFSPQVVQICGPEKYGSVLLRDPKQNVLRGVLFKLTTEAQRSEKARRNALTSSDKTNRPDYDFFKLGAGRPGYVSQRMDETTKFDPFEITQPGTYCLQYMLNESQHIQWSTFFVVKAGQPQTVKLTTPTEPPALQLGEAFQQTGLCLTFSDQFQNNCDCADIVQKVEFSLKVVGNDPTSKPLKFEVHAEPKQHYVDRAGKPVVSTFASSPASAPNELTLISSMHLSLRVMLTGQTTLASSLKELQLELSVKPQIRGEKLLKFTPFQSAPFSVRVVAGAAAKLIWLTDGMGVDEQDIIHIGSGADIPKLVVQLSDNSGLPVTQDSKAVYLRIVGAPDIPSHIICNWPQKGLTPVLQSPDSYLLNGACEFLATSIGIKAGYFQPDRLYADVEVEVAMKLQSGVNLTSQPQRIRIHATDVPTTVRICQTPSTSLSTPIRSKTSASATNTSTTPVAARSRSSSSARASPSTVPTASASLTPTVFSGEVGSELSLMIQLFDEANREVTIDALKEQIQSARRSFEQQDGGPEMSEIIVTPAAAASSSTAEVISVDDDDDVLMSEQPITGRTPTARGRKRKLTASVAEQQAKATSVRKRLNVEEMVRDGASIKISGLDGNTSFPLSFLPSDGILNGLTIPTQITHPGQPISCELIFTTSIGVALGTKFTVRQLSGPLKSMALKVLGEIAIDQPIGEMIQLHYMDAYANAASPPSDMGLTVVVRNSKREATTYDCSKAAPFANLQLLDAPLGRNTITVTHTDPSLAHLTAKEKIDVISGSTPTGMHFSLVDEYGAIQPTEGELVLQVTTHSYLPSFHVLMVDASGNSCLCDGEIVLKSSLFKEKKLPVIQGDCSLPNNTVLVRSRTSDCVVPIQLVFTLKPPSLQDESSSATNRRGRFTQINRLTASIPVHVTSTSRFITGMELIDSTIPALEIGVGQPFPTLRLRVKFEHPSDQLEEEDRAKFKLSFPQSRVDYPTPMIQLIPGERNVLVLAPPLGALVDTCGPHEFVIQFEETNVRLVELLEPKECKKSLKGHFLVVPGAPHSIQRTYELYVPSKADEAAPPINRLIASSINFEFVDAKQNPIPIERLPWSAALIQPDIHILIKPLDPNTPSPVLAEPELSIPTVTPNSIFMRSISISSNTALGSYEVEFKLTGIDLPIEPIRFELTDNTKLSRARLFYQKEAKKLAQRHRSVKDKLTKVNAKLRELDRTKPPPIQPMQHPTTGDVLQENDVKALIDQQRKLISKEESAPQLPVGARPKYSDAEQAVFNSDPNYLGLLPEVCSRLDSKDDCALISYFFQPKFKQHLFIKPDSSAHQQSRALKQTNFVLTRLPPPAPLPPLAPFNGNPAYIHALLSVGVSNPHIKECIRGIFGNAIIIDTRLDAEELLKQYRSSPTVLCRREKEQIQGGVDEAGRVALPFRQLLRDKSKGVFGVNAPAELTHQLNGLIAYGDSFNHQRNWISQHQHWSHERDTLVPQMKSMEDQQNRCTVALDQIKKRQMPPRFAQDEQEANKPLEDTEMKDTDEEKESHTNPRATKPSIANSSRSIASLTSPSTTPLTVAAAAASYSSQSLAPSTTHTAASYNTFFPPTATNAAASATVSTLSNYSTTAATPSTRPRQMAVRTPPRTSTSNATANSTPAHVDRSHVPSNTPR